jgi:UTP--glucose-1-phosphate uridylyltransferase
MKITKAVIPVAGKGTRFLPATKQVPKEMLPILKRPMVDYVVEEAVLSGMNEIVFVISTGKESILDYFDRNLELEQYLNKNGKEELAQKVYEIGTKIEVISVRQKEQLGLGHAIACAESAIGNENFAVILGDDIVVGDNPVSSQLAKASAAFNNKSVIGVMEIDKNLTNKYGIVDGVKVDDYPSSFKMNSMVEKPAPEDAPTNLATPGRYILTPEIFKCLKEIPRGVGGEYQLTDAINMLAKEDNVYAHIFEGDRYDTGTIEGYLKATVDFALKNEETKEVMRKILKEVGK